MLHACLTILEMLYSVLVGSVCYLSQIYVGWVLGYEKAFSEFYMCYTDITPVSYKGLHVYPLMEITACCLPKCMYSRKKIKLRASRFWCMQYPYAWITQSKIECNWVPKNHRGTKWWPARGAATVKVLICKRARARLPKACLLTSRRASALFGVPIWSHAVAVWNQEVQNQSSAEISVLIL